MTTNVPNPALRLSYAGTPGAWTAVLRANARVVASCGHSHRNRDGGQDNANICGIHHVIAARRESSAELLTNKALDGAARARRLGARISDDEARAKAEETINHWRGVVTKADFHLPADWSQRQAGRTCGCCPRAVVQAAMESA